MGGKGEEVRDDGGRFRLGQKRYRNRKASQYAVVVGVSVTYGQWTVSGRTVDVTVDIKKLRVFNSGR